jgi:hypothetical protein
VQAISSLNIQFTLMLRVTFCPKYHRTLRDGMGIMKTPHTLVPLQPLRDDPQFSKRGSSDRFMAVLYML